MLPDLAALDPDLLDSAALDAARDPWGTADWWLRGNALLGGAPAALLARGVADDLLTEAARALREPY
ncbi:hypothetical protein SAMN05421505_15319 [Sinosporangium album]|uniref:Uncharacterized protein n=2 Tax=Sinosporangium album TaxID=504805 RepID=A0A1G8KQ80_9ACTN|nr:hypothetical protein SAMN05421505_15319 [Sinosporangium album]